KQKRLNLLRGLEAILLDIDKAVRLVRETEEESEVVPNLMIGFGIDKIQAEYVAEIKLRHLNREYILKRTQEISELEAEILRLKEILDSPAKIKKLIVDELAAVAKKYGEARRSEIIYEDTMPEEEAEDDTMPDYPVTVFYTREGYFKKITPQSLRMSGEQKLKEGDVVTRQIETKNNAELLFFTSACQVYKCRVGDFEDGKASAMGDYIAARLGMDDGEIPLYMALTSDYKGSMLFLFANGKGAKVPLESYATKQNRKKLLNAFSDKAPLAHMEYLQEETELAIETSAGRLLLVGTAQIPAKLTKNTAGVNVITLKKNHTITSVRHADTMELANPHRYRVRTLPAAGAILRAEDLAEQTQLTL
ncbi:MAG: DNA gyrase subunit A, partial [Ruthenibacterium sp.]